MRDNILHEWSAGNIFEGGFKPLNEDIAKAAASTHKLHQQSLGGPHLFPPRKLARTETGGPFPATIYPSSMNKDPVAVFFLDGIFLKSVSSLSAWTLTPIR